MRLDVLANGHDAETSARLDERRAEDGFVSDVVLMLTYRPEVFGEPFSRALQQVMRGDSRWTVAERELFAAFVSAQNGCRF
jgi:hypothetical protein